MAKEAMRSKEGKGKAFRRLRAATAGTLGFAEAPGGVITSSLQGVDQAAQATWDPIYRGNVGDQSRAAAEFLAKYADRFHRGQQWHLPKLTGAAVLATVKRARASGAGMDGWRPREMRCLSRTAADLAAKIM